MPKQVIPNLDKVDMPNFHIAIILTPILQCCRNKCKRENGDQKHMTFKRD